MKVALVHDYIKEYGGAERVLESLHEIYPDADVYTSVYLPKYLGPHRKRFKNWKIKTTWFQYVPFNAKLLSPFRIVSALAFRQFDFSSYDVVIVSATGAFFPNAIRTKASHPNPLPGGEGRQRNGTLHICYCHTPPRYLYGYATARNWKKYRLFAALAMFANHFLRMVDFKNAQNVDFFIANSEEVAGRIKKFYRREATVIYPPVDVDEKKQKTKHASKKDYFLTGGRLARAKHFDVIVRACTRLGVPLQVFGKSFAGYGEELRKLAGDAVSFVSEVSEEEKLQLMSGAKAFLFASEDEDFGITPVEAMACGTPVIAHRSGGVIETVVEGKTGVFFNALTAESLEGAIRKFEKMKISSEDCRKQAEKFSKKRFDQRIAAFVSSKIKR